MKLLTPFLAFVIVLSAAGLAQAVSPAANRFEQRSEALEQRQETLEQRQETLENRQATLQLQAQEQQQRREQRCEAVRQRLAELPSLYRQRHQNHVRVFERVATAGETALSKFAAAGLDTATLAKHIDALRAQINKFNADGEAYLASLPLVDPCAADDTIKPGQWTNARSLLNILGTDVKDARAIMQNQLRPEIVRLMKLMPQPSPGAVTPTVEVAE